MHRSPRITRSVGAREQKQKIVTQSRSAQVAKVNKTGLASNAAIEKDSRKDRFTG